MIDYTCHPMIGLFPFYCMCACIIFILLKPNAKYFSCYLNSERLNLKGCTILLDRFVWYLTSSPHVTKLLDPCLLVRDVLFYFLLELKSPRAFLFNLVNKIY